MHICYCSAVLPYTPDTESATCLLHPSGRPHPAGYCSFQHEAAHCMTSSALRLTAREYQFLYPLLCSWTRVGSRLFLLRIMLQ